MADHKTPRVRHGKAFWRAHHEAWRRSDLNQREYCAAEGIPLKAFGNWRAKFTAEPEATVRQLLYCRSGLSHRLSHTFSHTLSHMTYPSFEEYRGPSISPAKPEHRRRFSEASH